MEREADFSVDRRYRYSLRRRWSEGPGLCAVLLNPSRADAGRDDPTTTWMVRRAQARGFGRYEAVNLFALVDPDPAALRACADPVGADNDAWILRAIARADRVLVAWGRHGALHGRARHVLGLLRDVPLLCLGTNRDGSPRFPRAVSAATRWRTFRP